ncbi:MULTISPECIES: helix-turn-helix transcriptional regulator [Actinoalloteichus]|uniref:Transcriptional regulator, luxR family n=1 Tax=Actinoalloteichus fjordicus TaxID=1612552 RepID=A0AAC9LFI4_9PSEU|nr:MULTISPECIES: helix-turn-helix transcriptional regulator [Actinoalloteichus]APU15827.1 transcriptional regulator, luxR family [Actinoalloteichus fjordicus]APU21887.1 transcriptional regulator, luxR family [Actinoalloteichus sp. GBA129-24]
MANRRERERQALGDLRDLAKSGVTTRELFRELDGLLPSVVGFDAVCWHHTDPLTGLPTSMVSTTLDPRGMTHAMDLEFGNEDVGTMAQMQAQGSLVAAISQTTQGRPERSVRMREHLSGYGFGDELRLRCDLGEGSWGFAAFMREKARGPYSDEELRFVGQANRLITGALRRAHLPRTAPTEPPPVPAVVILGSSDELIAADQPGQALLLELADSAFDVLAVPAAFLVTARLARLTEADPAGIPAAMRVQTRDGQWIILRGSVLHGVGTAQVVVTASTPTPAEIMPVVLSSHGLTRREQLVTGEVLHGGSTREIAKALSLAQVTVQDHLKSIFAKVGVHSRGELVALLSLGGPRPGGTDLGPAPGRE